MAATGLDFMTVWAIVPAVIAILLIALLALRPRRATAGRLSRGESWIASLIGAGAMMAVVLGVITLIWGAARSFGEDPSRLTDMPYSGSIQRFADSPPIVDAGYESAWLDVTDIPLGARWLLFLEVALPALAMVAIGVAVAWLAIMVIRGRPFARALPTMIGAAAIAIVVAGMGAQVTGAFGRALVVEDIGVQVSTGCDSEGPCESLGLMALNIDPAPIAWGLGLALVAVAFRVGSRLQQDTRGLV